MYTTAPLADGTPQTYAFGLGHDNYRGLPIVKHGGGLNGARTQMIRFGAQVLERGNLEDTLRNLPEHSVGAEVTI